MTTEQTRQRTDRFVQAYLAADIDAITALLADDVIHYPPPSLAVDAHEGPAATAAALAEPLGDGVLQGDTIKREATMKIVDGDGALVKIGVNAKTTEGAEYRNEIVLILGFRDGAIVRVDEISDTLNDYDRSIVQEIPAWSGSSA